ncbi:hypothetical protein GCM10010517_12510 [Streptosporangium fragile]|uniref:Uncharacterized protein n=1 Tax=Streptosporangium fragile TaxID=46186 RepID=A0ABN3VUS0_9ACTN
MSNNFGSSPGGPPQGPGYGASQQPYGQQYQQGSPSYGYPTPNYGPPQGTPAKTKVKPSLGWIFGSWLVAFLSIGVGVLVLYNGAAGAADAITDAAPTKSFAAGEAVTVKLDPADKPALYVSATSPTNYECAIEGGETPPRLEKAAVSQTVTLNGDVWEMGLRIGVDKAGDYQVRCTADDASVVKFGVGKELALGSAVSGALGGVAAGLGIPLVFFLVAIIMTIVVLVKRSGARKRQAAAAAASGQWGQPGPYGR